MAKILNIDDMLEAAEQSNMPEFRAHADRLEDAASELALALAKHLKIEAGPAEWMGIGLAGLAATFNPTSEGQECPELIDECDPSGEWTYWGAAKRASGEVE